MGVKGWAERVGIELNELVGLAKSSMAEFKAINSIYNADDEYFTVVLATLGKGRDGNEHKFNAVAKLLGKDPKGMDTLEDWDILEAAGSEIAEWLTAQGHESGLPGFFFFGHNEGDGDYDLFYREDSG